MQRGMLTGRKPRLEAIMPRHQTDTSDSRISRKLRRPVLVLLMMILIVSCASPGPPAEKETVHELGLEPRRLARVGRSVLAGRCLGEATGGRTRINWRRSSSALHCGRFQHCASGIAASD